MSLQTHCLEHEKKLLARISQDDEAAFCELYSLYKMKLYYFAQKLIKSKEYAEDICQDTFAIIWQNRYYINVNLPFSSYLFTIARNRILNILRDIHKEEYLHEYIISQAIDFTSTAQDTVSIRELNEILSQAIEKLTGRQKQIFKMSREDGMSHKEIAEFLNISIHTVKEHLSLALKTIHNILDKHYGCYSAMFFLLCSNC
ncbi:MAG: RNA polymerase sigma-70 factor [Prevotella sp.]|jgi:RNA polymerase sigma-70 factor (ECF subfamily)|nr:RNA polymerase sigma-70 factor [Prevotella sp.]